MFEKLGHLIVKRRKSAVILFIVGILVAGVVGSTVFTRLDSGGYSDPNSDSYKVYEYLNDELNLSDPAQISRRSPEFLFGQKFGFRLAPFGHRQG